MKNIEFKTLKGSILELNHSKLLKLNLNSLKKKTYQNLVFNTKQNQHSFLLILTKNKRC